MIGRTLTAIVTAAFIGLSSVGGVAADEPKKTLDTGGKFVFEALVPEDSELDEESIKKKPREKPLRCGVRVKRTFWQTATDRTCVRNGDEVIYFGSPGNIYVYEREHGDGSSSSEKLTHFRISQGKKSRSGREPVYRKDSTISLDQATVYQNPFIIGAKKCNDYFVRKVLEVTSHSDRKSMGVELNLSNPKIRKAAENKLCDYVHVAGAHLYMEQKSKERRKEKEQLDLLK